MANQYNTGKIRVAFFAEILIEDADGASRTMFQLLKRIDKNQFDFMFFCGTGPDEVVGFPCIKVPALTFPMNRNYKLTLPFLSNRKLNEHLVAFAPQVVHIATPSMLGEFAIRYAGKHQLPVLSIYHTHFISYTDYYLSFLPFLIKTMRATIAATQRKFYNQCAVIYVPSESIAAELASLGIEPHRMKIWKRGINTQLFTPGKRNLPWIQNLTGNTNRNILFASRLVWEKNLKTLFAVYDLIQQQNLPYNLIIAGDGQAHKACEKHMKAAVFTGNLSHGELAQLYASADVFLFPSVSEAYGNVVVEAMASGLPCVIADGGGSKDFIQQGENGFTCQPYDATDYVNRINMILIDAALANRFSAAGLQYSRGLDWNTLADIYFDDIANLAHSAEHKMNVTHYLPA